MSLGWMHALKQASEIRSAPDSWLSKGTSHSGCSHPDKDGRSDAPCPQRNHSHTCCGDISRDLHVASSTLRSTSPLSQPGTTNQQPAAHIMSIPKTSTSVDKHSSKPMAEQRSQSSPVSTSSGLDGYASQTPRPKGPPLLRLPTPDQLWAGGMPKGGGAPSMPEEPPSLIVDALALGAGNPEFRGTPPTTPVNAAPHSKVRSWRTDGPAAVLCSPQGNVPPADFRKMRRVQSDCVDRLRAGAASPLSAPGRRDQSRASLCNLSAGKVKADPQQPEVADLALVVAACRQVLEEADKGTCLSICSSSLSPSADSPLSVQRPSGGSRQPHVAHPSATPSSIFPKPTESTSKDLESLRGICNLGRNKGSALRAVSPWIPQQKGEIEPPAEAVALTPVNTRPGSAMQGRRRRSPASLADVRNVTSVLQPLMDLMSDMAAKGGRGSAEEAASTRGAGCLPEHTIDSNLCMGTAGALPGDVAASEDVPAGLLELSDWDLLNEGPTGDPLDAGSELEMPEALIQEQTSTPTIRPTRWSSGADISCSADIMGLSPRPEKRKSHSLHGPSAPAFALISPQTISSPRCQGWTPERASSAQAQVGPATLPQAFPTEEASCMLSRTSHTKMHPDSPSTGFRGSQVEGQASPCFLSPPSCPGPHPCSAAGPEEHDDLETLLLDDPDWPDLGGCEDAEMVWPWTDSSVAAQDGMSRSQSVPLLRIPVAACPSESGSLSMPGATESCSNTPKKLKPS